MEKIWKRGQVGGWGARGYLICALSELGGAV